MEAAPEDYLWTLCAYMSLPFWLPACAEKIMLSTEARFRLFGTKPVHLAAAVLVSAASCFTKYRDSVTAAAVAKTLGCCARSVQRVVAMIPHYELQFTGPISDVEHRWLVKSGQRTVNVMPSSVACRASDNSDRQLLRRSHSDMGISIKFKRKSKRQQMAEEKRRIIAERVRQQQKEQQHA